MERFDALIVGGGIAGAAIAYHLAHDHRFRVGLYDAGGLRSGATDSSAGILSYQGWDAWDLAIVRASAREYATLADRLGLAGYVENGGLRVARTPEGAEWLRRVEAVLLEAGARAETADASRAATLQPSFSLDDVRLALYTPEDALFSPSELRHAYLRLARDSGAELSLSGPPAPIDRQPSGWRVHHTNGSVDGDRLVLAAGAWTKSILRDLGLWLPLAPFRSHVSELRTDPLLASGPTVHDLDLDLYLRGSSRGRLLVGDGTERRESDPNDRSEAGYPDFERSAIERLRALLPDARGVSVERTWAGLCVATPDRFPMLGRVAGVADLYVATGFNGLGAMRAGGFAAALADSMASGNWESLAPADPQRFADQRFSFEPQPEFPLEAEGPWPKAAGDWPPTLKAEPSPIDRDLTFRALPSHEEVRELQLPSLSEWFDPFLKRFLEDARRTGGRAEVAEENGSACGVYLAGRVEEAGSIFTHRRGVAEHYLAALPPSGIYSDFRWRPGGMEILLLGADLRDWSIRYRLRNPVRIATPADMPSVRSLMQELGGPIDERWFEGLPRPDELCFACELDGRLVGVSWATIAERHARGHSFLVHPRFRGLGFGTDLLHARMTWLKREGILDVVSEIYSGNAASQTAAERAGMAIVGRMYHWLRPPVGEPDGIRSGAPRTSGNSWPLNP